MVAINRVGRWRGFLGAHGCDLTRRKTIGFEIGKAPIGVAETVSDGHRRLVGLDSLFLPSEALERMAEQDVQFGGARRGVKQLAIQRDSLFVSSETDARGC